MVATAQAGVTITTDASSGEYDKVYEFWTGDSSNASYDDKADSSLAQTITTGAGGLVVENINFIYIIIDFIYT